MNRFRFKRMLFVVAVCLASLPWLTPCVALLPAVIIQRATLGDSRGDPTMLAPIKRRALADGAGLPFVVRADQRIPRSLLISESQWSRLEKERWLMDDGTHALTGHRARFFGSAAAGGSTAGDHSTQAASGKRRDDKVLLLQPLVVLEADRLLLARFNAASLPVLAEARTTSMAAKAVIHARSGNLFAEARHICFRASSSELILEGNAVVRSGRRQIRAADASALMRVNLLTLTVDVGGAVTETIN